LFFFQTRLIFSSQGHKPKFQKMEGMEMSWKSYAAEAKRGGGQQTVIGADEVKVRYFSPKAGSPRLLIRVGSDLLSQAKIKVKDKVDLLTNEDGSQALIRKSEKGWTVYGINGSGGEINLPWRDDRRLFNFSSKAFVKMNGAKVGEGGVIFEIPKVAQAENENA
jgi:hypothetical protein